MPPGKCRQPNSKRKWAGLFEKDAQLQASIRAKVEHPFHVIQTLLDHRKTRNKGLAKNEMPLFRLERVSCRRSGRTAWGTFPALGLFSWAREFGDQKVPEAFG